MFDKKVTKRHFPKCNNNNLLEFVFEKDPNCYLRKNSIIIRGSIEIDENHIVENGWVAKLFSQMRVEVDSQVVTRNTNRYDHLFVFGSNVVSFFSSDYYYKDWLYKIGNFDSYHLTSAFMVEGYYDNYNFGSDKLVKLSDYVENRTDCSVKNNGKTRWEFAFTPTVGFLGNNDELLSNCELKISFDRAPPYNALLRLDGETEYSNPLDLLDVYATTEYVSSPGLRDKFSMIDFRPFTYNFDDCDVLVSVSDCILIL